MEALIHLFLRPEDLLRPRDPRAGSAGEQSVDHLAAPLPSALLGMLRGGLFRSRGADFAQGGHFGLSDAREQAWLGSAQAPGSLSLIGPIWARRADPLELWCWDPPKEEQKAAEQSPPGLRVWFNGRPLQPEELGPPGPRDKAEERPCWVQREQRVGVGRDLGLRSVREGLLYEREGWRLEEDCGLYLGVQVEEAWQVEALRALVGQRLQLGGKGHRVLVEELTPAELGPAGLPSDLQHQGPRLRLLTPLRWSADLARDLGPCLKARRLRQGPRLSSYDMASGQPRPSMACLEPGSEFRVDPEGEQLLLQRGLLDQPWPGAGLCRLGAPEDRHAGWGLALRLPEQT